MTDDRHAPSRIDEDTIPRTLAPCFQEYDFEMLEPARHGELIIERVLVSGDRNELHWLFARYGKSTVREWVARTGELRLPWRRYNMWCTVLDVALARQSPAVDQRVWPH